MFPVAGARQLWTVVNKGSPTRKYLPWMFSGIDDYVADARCRFHQWSVRTSKWHVLVVVVVERKEAKVTVTGSATQSVPNSTSR